jgi:hypothetical protein
MKRKFILLASLVLVFTLGFIYVNHNYISANGRDGKNTCTNMTGCTQHKSNTIKAGGEWSSYEFTTDKACCEEMQSSLKSELMSAAGVKDVKFSQTCTVSKMTNVSIYYSASETNEETLASLIKDKGFDCSSGCDKKNCPEKNSKKTSGKNI